MPTGREFRFLVPGAVFFVTLVLLCQLSNTLLMGKLDIAGLNGLSSLLPAAALAYAVGYVVSMLTVLVFQECCGLVYMDTAAKSLGYAKQLADARSRLEHLLPRGDATSKPTLLRWRWNAFYHGTAPEGLMNFVTRQFTVFYTHRNSWAAYWVAVCLWSCSLAWSPASHDVGKCLVAAVLLGLLLTALVWFLSRRALAHAFGVQYVWLMNSDQPDRLAKPQGQAGHDSPHGRTASPPVEDQPRKDEKDAPD